MVHRDVSAYLSIQLLVCTSVFLFTKIKVHIVTFTLAPPLYHSDCYTALDLHLTFTFSSRGVSLFQTLSDKHFLWNNRSIRLHPVQRGVIFLEKVQGQHFLRAKAEIKSAKQFEGADSSKLDYIFQFKIWSVLLFSRETFLLLTDLQRFLSSQETVNE